MTVTGTETFKYDQVSRYINELIEKGDLKPGDKAPSLRKLSKQLGVSIATITQSYVNLEDQGVLTAKPQSGFYVNTLVNQINDIDKSAATNRRRLPARRDACALANCSRKYFATPTIRASPLSAFPTHRWTSCR